MGEKTAIAWTDHTFNPVWGCTRVSEGCRHCYAETWAKRHGTGWGPQAERRTFGPQHWEEPHKWNRAAERDGVRRRVFCASMCDICEDHPVVAAEVEKLWPLIRATPNLDWQLLTKRPERFAIVHPNGEYPNVWLGTSCEDQKTLDERVPHLRNFPAAVRFLSLEPLLTPIDLRFGIVAGKMGVRVATPRDIGIHWIIVGGETGPGHRPCEVAWIDSIVEQCRVSGVPCFVKQDSGRRPGAQGRLSDAIWAVKQFPLAVEAKRFSS